MKTVFASRLLDLVFQFLNPPIVLVGASLADARNTPTRTTSYQPAPAPAGFNFPISQLTIRRSGRRRGPPLHKSPIHFRVFGTFCGHGFI
jgi:hypothetical protein